jgi:hypothetical protein
VQLDSAEQRFQLFDAVTCALRAAAIEAPLLVILDDLHAADPSSLALLLFVARELRDLRVCLVGTLRGREVVTSPDAREALARISREAHTLEVARFTADEVRSLLFARSVDVDETTLASVFGATEGLPLFVAEVARSRPVAGKWVVPETVRAALQARVASLSDAVREVMEAAAVLGRETARSTLAALLGQSESQLNPQLSAALAAGVAVESEPGTVAFSHALLREAVYRELPEARRHELHERAADLLERTRATETGWGEIANHLLAALPRVGPERALSGSLRAAERALRTYAFEDAAAILEQALGAVAGAAALDPRISARALRTLASAATDTSFSHRARDPLAGAASDPRQLELAPDAITSDALDTSGSQQAREPVSAAASGPRQPEHALRAITSSVLDTSVSQQARERVSASAIDPRHGEHPLGAITGATLDTSVSERGGGPAAGAAIDPRLVCETLLVLGEAQIRAHRDGKAACVRAAELARQLNDASLFARAGLALGAEIWVGRVDPALIGILEESLRVLPREPSALRARVLARLAGALQPAYDPEHPMTLAREAIAMARSLGDESSLRIVLQGAGSALVDYAPLEERLNVDHQMLTLAESAHDWPLAFRARLRLYFDHLQRGAWESADAAMQGCDALVERLRRPAVRWYVALLHALRADVLGDFAASDRYRAQASELIRNDEHANGREPVVVHHFAHALLRHHHERLSEVVPLAHAAALPPSIGEPLYALLLALCHAREGKHAQAEELVRPIDLNAPSFKIELVSLHLLGEVCALSELREPAALAADHLQQFADQITSWGVWGFGVFGPVNGLRAALLGVLERYDEAFALFESAMTHCRKLGARPALARTLYDYARARVRRGQPNDRELACTLLDEAASLARELEMRGLIDWINALKAQPLLAAAKSSSQFESRARAVESQAAPPAADGGARLGSGRRADRALDALRRTAFSLTRDADFWAITHGARVFRLKHTRGLAMLARLVEQPGREVHALTLGTELDPGDLGDAGSAIDTKAVRVYRERIEALREREQTAETMADADAADRARTEIDQIAQHLSAALGLGGKERKASSAAERARVNVQRRIKDAINRIAREDPELGRYLGLCIRTGTFSVFTPID